MGVRYLWELLREFQCGEPHTIRELAGLTLAVDLSVWVMEGVSIDRANGYGRPRNVPAPPDVGSQVLRNLFYRTINLTRRGIRLVFVSDGTPPAMKQRNGKRIRHQHNNPTIKRCRELVALFGLPFVEVRSGEAEAMCAYLNTPIHERHTKLQHTTFKVTPTKHKTKSAAAAAVAAAAAGGGSTTGGAGSGGGGDAVELPYVDGIITPDNDAFLFGARMVVKSLEVSATKRGAADVYRLSTIETKTGLGRNKLVCMGLLLGGDYAHEGVIGIGAKRAHQLLSQWRGDDTAMDDIRRWIYDAKETASVSASERKASLERELKTKPKAKPKSKADKSKPKSSKPATASAGAVPAFDLLSADALTELTAKFGIKKLASTAAMIHQLGMIWPALSDEQRRTETAWIRTKTGSASAASSSVSLSQPSDASDGDDSDGGGGGGDSKSFDSPFTSRMRTRIQLRYSCASAAVDEFDLIIANYTFPIFEYRYLPPTAHARDGGTCVSCNRSTFNTGAVPTPAAASNSRSGGGRGSAVDTGYVHAWPQVSALQQFAKEHIAIDELKSAEKLHAFVLTQILWHHQLTRSDRHSVLVPASIVKLRVEDGTQLAVVRWGINPSLAGTAAASVAAAAPEHLQALVRRVLATPPASATAAAPLSQPSDDADLSQSSAAAAPASAAAVEDCVTSVEDLSLLTAACAAVGSSLVADFMGAVNRKRDAKAKAAAEKEQRKRDRADGKAPSAAAAAAARRAKSDSAATAALAVAAEEKQKDFNALAALMVAKPVPKPKPVAAAAPAAMAVVALAATKPTIPVAKAMANATAVRSAAAAAIARTKSPLRAIHSDDDSDEAVAPPRAADRKSSRTLNFAPTAAAAAAAVDSPPDSPPSPTEDHIRRLRSVFHRPNLVAPSLAASPPPERADPVPRFPSPAADRALNRYFAERKLVPSAAAAGAGGAKRASSTSPPTIVDPLFPATPPPKPARAIVPAAAAGVDSDLLSPLARKPVSKKVKPNGQTPAKRNPPPLPPAQQPSSASGVVGVVTPVRRAVFASNADANAEVSLLTPSPVPASRSARPRTAAATAAAAAPAVRAAAPAAVESVYCPFCLKPFASSDINAHANQCLSPAQSKPKSKPAAAPAVAAAGGVRPKIAVAAAAAAAVPLPLLRRLIDSDTDVISLIDDDDDDAS